jgi:hypothetical protein
MRIDRPTITTITLLTDQLNTRPRQPRPIITS